MNPLSAKNRAAVIRRLDNEYFDLVIIGGGITGAGIALDASSRGMKVALIEMNDFASGTSSKSTKLVHGGLRYLKQLEVALVREVGLERAIVHRLAPHLVAAEKMLLPLVEGGTYGKLSTSFGLMVYDFLADVHDDDKRKMLSKEETLQHEPILRKKGLKGGGIYAEYRTDDARLTIETIKTATKYDALSLNYVKAESFSYENDTIIGVQCRDLLNDATFEITASYVVSAAGPWVDKLRKVDKSLEGKHLFLSKGSHIVVPHERLPIQQAVYFDVPDGRMMFAIPRNRVTYLGTTDTPYDGDINDVVASKADGQYILDGTNKMFTDVNLTLEDVESSWAGLRPLIHEEGKSTSEMSRKDEIFESETGLISIAGGKLTGYRKMAERIVDLVSEKFEKEYDKEFGDCFTDKIPLGGGLFGSEAEVFEYQKVILSNIQKMGLDDSFASYLVRNYGRQVDDILASAKNSNEPAETAIAKAELKHCIDKELVFTAMDFFNRRTGRLYFNIITIQPVLEEILMEMSNTFNWNAARIEKERASVLEAIKKCSNLLG